MNPVLKEMYATGSVKDREGNSIDCFYTSISYETGEALYNFIRRHIPKETLEVGMAYGASTLFICQALKENGVGHHTVIDPHQDTMWKSIGILNLRRAKLDNLISFFDRPSYEVLPHLYTQNKLFEFAFIDGMHLFDYALVDFFYIDKFLKVGGFVAFDDLWMPSIQRVVSFVLRNRAYRLIKIGTHLNVFQYVWDVAGRIRRNPFIWNLKTILIPGNICFVEKLANDGRNWKHYCSF